MTYFAISWMKACDTKTSVNSDGQGYVLLAAELRFYNAIFVRRDIYTLCYTLWEEFSEDKL